MSRVADVLNKSRNAGARTLALALDQGAGTTTGHPWGFRSDGPRALSESLAPAPPAGARADSYAYAAPGYDYHALAARLFLDAAPEAAPRTIVFSPAGAAVGSAGVCAGVADALAQSSPGSVCLVEADLRDATLDVTFGMTPTDGLWQVLAGTRPVAACLKSLRDNLWLLPAGVPAAGAPGFVGRELYRHLDELRGAFDFVIVNASAPDAHPDPATIARAADGVVLVIDAATTRRHATARLADALRAVGVPLLGAVLTNRTFPIPESVYRRL